MEQAPAFVLFDTDHLVALAVVAAAAVLAGRSARPAAPWLGWLIAAALIIQELIKLQLFIGELGQDWRRSLPLDICRINELVCVYMLARRSYRAFEVAYFWAMGASVSAMLTPALPSGFPSALYFLFFLGHGLSVLAVIYAIFALGFRPRLSSLFLCLAVTACYAAVMVPVNLLLDANYLFLREKPPGTTVVDLLGPWPVYLFALFGLAALVSTLCYLPFGLAQRWRTGRWRAT